MTKVFVFGDSFGTPAIQDWSWASIISKSFDVINRAAPGASCTRILSHLKTAIKHEISNDDFVIVFLSDRIRDYMDLSDANWDEKSIKFYKKAINKIHWILNKRKINYVVLWSFPSDYETSINWSSLEFVYIDKNTYRYFIDFKNEIRPALIYYSRKELSHITDSTELSKVFAQDKRPNHISDKNIHKKIAEIIEKFILKEKSGCVNLEE